MYEAWLITLLPLLTLSINVAFQLLVVHLSHRIGLSIITGLAAGFIINLIVLFMVSANIENICIDLLSYLALSFSYWTFLNLNITALRIRVLRELLKENKTGLTTETLLQRYSSKELINRRLDRLKQWGHIIKIDGQWILQSNKLLFLVYTMVLLRQIIFGKEKARRLLT